MSSTLVFPISGNPIGFNHFAAVEFLLRRVRHLEQALLVLSNGRHPDPTKPDAEVDAPTRLALAETAVAAASQPGRSYLARQAELAGDSLHLSPRGLAVSTVELGFERAVRTVELLPLLRADADDPEARLQWLAGSDLVRRMAEPAIFSDEDLRTLADNLHYHVLERAGDPAQPALEHLHATRGVRLEHTVHRPAEAPHWLATFLALSSTAIRHAAEAGDPLAGMLPAPAAQVIAEQGLYREGRLAARLVAPDGSEVGRRSQLALMLEGLEADLAREADALADALQARRAAERPHSLSLVETSTGGLLTAALAGRSGASRFFRQARFAYDAHAKTSLVGRGLPGASAVSPEAVGALAEAVRREARTDYALAESGMAGPPEATRRSLKSGQCWVAWAGPAATHTLEVRLDPFATRREHQHRFALEALGLARRVLAEEG